MGPTPPAPSSAEWDKTNPSRLVRVFGAARPSRQSNPRLLRPESPAGFALNAARSEPRSGRIAGGAGGEQAANSLQPAGSSRHATTLNAKVEGMMEALRLVTKWRCWRSHGRGHRSWDAPHVAMAALGRHRHWVRIDRLPPPGIRSALQFLVAVSGGSSP